MKHDILIKNAIILPTPGQKTIIDRGYVLITGNKITRLGPMQALPDNTCAAQTIDASNHLVMPGLINCHCHGAMTLFRGLADDLPLMSWLNEHIFPAEGKFVTKEMVYLCTQLAAVEMILSGTTMVADGYFYEEQAAAAFQDVGIRAMPAQGIIDFPAPGVPDPSKNISSGANFLDGCNDKSLITPALFCHSPYTCSAKTLQAAKELAKKRNSKLFIHLAETKEEVEQSVETHGLSPVRYLEKLQILDSDTICVHCNWLDSDDIEIIKKYDCGVVTCPESNMKLAAGIAPVDEMLKNGINIGLGTDGCASNNDLDLFCEMDSLAKLHKVANMDPTAVSANQTLTMVTSGGAKLLSQEKKVGILAPGMLADMIIIELNKPHLTPFYNPDLLVYSAKGSDVETVIIDGRIVMQNHKVLTVDIEEIMEKVKELSQALNNQQA